MRWIPPTGPHHHDLNDSLTKPFLMQCQKSPHSFTISCWSQQRVGTAAVVTKYNRKHTVTALDLAVLWYDNDYKFAPFCLCLNRRLLARNSEGHGVLSQHNHSVVRRNRHDSPAFPVEPRWWNVSFLVVSNTFEIIFESRGLRGEDSPVFMHFLFYFIRESCNLKYICYGI